MNNKTLLFSLSCLLYCRTLRTTLVLTNIFRYLGGPLSNRQLVPSEGPQSGRWRTARTQWREWSESKSAPFGPVGTETPREVQVRAFGPVGTESPDFF